MVAHTRNAKFGELWPTNPWDPRDTKFLKNDTRVKFGTLVGIYAY